MVPEFLRFFALLLRLFFDYSSIVLSFFKLFTFFSHTFSALYHAFLCLSAPGLKLAHFAGVFDFLRGYRRLHATARVFGYRFDFS